MKNYYSQRSRQRKMRPRALILKTEIRDSRFPIDKFFILKSSFFQKTIQVKLPMFFCYLIKMLI